MLCKDLSDILESISVQSVEETTDVIVGGKDLVPQSADDFTT